MGNWFRWPKKVAAYKEEHLDGFEVVYGFVRSCKFTPVSSGYLARCLG